MEEESLGLNALEELKKEHQEVLSQLDTLEVAIVELAKEQAGIDSEALRVSEAVIQFLDKDLDIHFRKEEEVLFPALSGYVGREGGPIGVMLMEHEDLRRSLHAFRNALGIFRAEPQPASRENVLKGGYGLISLLRLHIKKEDNCLFLMAGSYLNRTRLREMGAEMQAMVKESSSPPG